MRFHSCVARASALGLSAMLAILAVVVLGTASAQAAAPFGLSEFDVSFTGPEGETVSQAGSHPYQMSIPLHFDSTETGEGGESVEQSPKNVIVAQMPGFVGNPTAVPRCSTADFLTSIEIVTTSGKQRVPDCPDTAAVGTASVGLAVPVAKETFYGPVYNLEAPPGVAAKLGFWIASVPITIELGVSENPPYNVVGGPTNISQVLEVFASKLVLWGTPADARHDALRGRCLDPVAGGSLGNCPANISKVPFLTLPRACRGPQKTSYRADSWQEPDVFVEGFSESHDETGEPLGMTGCGRLGFSPEVSAEPTTRSASSPTGLDFSLDVNDEGLVNPEGIADSDIREAVVTLPEGMTANPALAEGLGACSETDLASETIDAAPGEGCPRESKIGTVEVETPLLSQILKGSLFLATPYENPFGSLLGLYVVIKNPETGVLIKLPGKVVPDETTGRLKSVFSNLPQLPFSHFRLNFREGQRSPLVTPPSCGTYTTTADLVPWANPEMVLHQTATFKLTSGVAGGPCPSDSTPPFNPGLTAGTLNNQAGSYSPMNIRITRNDTEQEITGFSSLLPPGVTANLNGIPFCTEAQIAAAKTKTGAQEQTEPSCPKASEIGHTLVGVGVGSVLAYTPGKLYMAGPYQGAPFSVAAITSAKVGPFDLGTVIVHLPLNIDPATAQVSIPTGAADQIPHIVKGIVVHVRDIRVYVDRPNFTLNPTNCNPLTFGASVIGSGANFASAADDVAAGVNNPFQAANCASLGFKPIFKVSTSGKTSRKNGASLSVKLAYPKEALGKDTNIHMVKVNLPKQLPSRLTTLQQACTDAQFTANPAGCPAASRVGVASAITPILPVPITGPAYFVSHGGAKFPELILVLQGYGVTIDLHGETFISKAGITSSTFSTVPDQPVASFELTLPQGPNSALAANGNLCTSTLKMPTLFVGQNGATIKQSTPISVTGCPKAKKHKKAKKASRHHHRRNTKK